MSAVNEWQVTFIVVIKTLCLLLNIILSWFQIHRHVLHHEFYKVNYVYLAYTACKLYDWIAKVLVLEHITVHSEKLFSKICSCTKYWSHLLSIYWRLCQMNCFFCFFLLVQNWKRIGCFDSIRRKTIKKYNFSVDELKNTYMYI